MGCCRRDSNPHFTESRSVASAGVGLLQRDDAARRTRTCNTRVLNPMPLPVGLLRPIRRFQPSNLPRQEFPRPPRDSNPHEPALQAGASPFEPEGRSCVACVGAVDSHKPEAEAAGVEPASLPARADGLRNSSPAPRAIGASASIVCHRRPLGVASPRTGLEPVLTPRQGAVRTLTLTRHRSDWAPWILRIPSSGFEPETRRSKRRMIFRFTTKAFCD